MINGGTGPVLAFTEILYKVSKSMDVPFLTLNAWIGIWVSIYMFIAAFIDLNRIIVLCTRFTDEIFSFLISLIFIINAIGSPFSTVGVAHYFDMNHKSHDAYEDQPYYSHWASALLSLIIFLGTTYGKWRLNTMCVVCNMIDFAPISLQYTYKSLFFFVFQWPFSFASSNFRLSCPIRRGETL